MPAPLVGLAVGALARVAAKKIAGNAVKKTVTKKTAKAAEIQKIRTEQMQKRSVKVIPPSRTTKTGDTTSRKSPYAQSNKDKAKIMKNIKSGKFAKDLEKNVVQSKPAKVVKINSGTTKPSPKKSSK